MLIAHLSDPHVGLRPDAADRFRQVVSHLVAVRPAPDVVILTGDVADHGMPEEYELARKILAPMAIPVVVGTGNHDVREHFAAAFAPGHEGPVDTAIDVGGYRFLMLDSLVPAPPGGRVDYGTLSPQTLDWLDRHLDDGRPSFVCLHHPPVDIHVRPADNVKLTNAAELEAVLRRHGNVVAVLVGHAHTMCATTFAGLPLLIGGGITSTVCLDEEDMPSPNTAVAPTLAWHLVGEDNRVVTHWRSL
ncbi:metallophosphoesterase [Micromonospora sp. NPDC048999]|uniref:metallophosphoesterase n=1 Tax=Micromonospora sp. NPDC048999 TaxID=3155391 RepID=UPI0033DA23DB